MRLTERTWFIILMLVIFFPIGIFLMWRSNWNKIVKVIVSIMFAIGIVGAITEEKETTQVDSGTVVEKQIVEEKKEDKKREEPKEPIKTEEELKADFIGTCNTFTYKDIQRNPDNFKDKPIKITGKVIQASEGFLDSVTFRVAADAGEYDLYLDDIYLVTYKYKDGESKILEDDMVRFYGVCNGTTSYKSITGQAITIPSATLKYYDINE